METRFKVSQSVLKKEKEIALEKKKKLFKKYAKKENLKVKNIKFIYKDREIIFNPFNNEYTNRWSKLTN